MRRDELRQPLRKRSLRERLWARRPSALALAIVLTGTGLAGGGGWLTRQPLPFAGEPVVVAAIPPAEAIATSSLSIPEEPVEEGSAEEAPEEVLPAEEETAVIVPRRRPLEPAPIASVAEDTPAGQLPRVGDGGRKPSEVYARLTPMSVLTSGRPKIVIVLGGMGLNPKLTAKAIASLPADITFAFAPYGEGLQDQVNKARAEGHEILLQTPMEPPGYPARNPGPKTLLAEASAEENLDALHWHMSRFAGYTGLTNYMGGRFLANPETLRPVLAELKSRGLVFLEDATVPLSATAAVAKTVGLQQRRALIVIDAEPDPASIGAALRQLEQAAKDEGVAIGTGAGLAVTIDALGQWARELDERGFLLIPLSASFKGKLG